MDLGENFGFGFTFVLNTGEAERNSRNVRSQALTILPASPVNRAEVSHSSYPHVQKKSDKIKIKIKIKNQKSNMKNENET